MAGRSGQRQDRSRPAPQDCPAAARPGRVRDRAPGSPVPVTTLALSTTAGAQPASQPAATTSGGLAASPAPRVLSPHLAACCQIAMGVTMGYMLVLML
ncbi:MAG TPA: hypothetical protein VF933_33200 [Streptosporangiaceae bacterium]